MRRLLPMAHDETVVAGSFTISGTARQNMTATTQRAVVSRLSYML